MMKRIVVLLFSFCCSSITAQHGVSLVYSPSKVIKHRKNLLFDVPARTHEFRLSYTFQTDDSREWQQYWKQPRLVVNALFVNFGDKDVLGNAYGVLPEIHFPIKKWKALSLNMQFGTGIAYLNKPYDAVDNPSNNAIGSFLNNVTSLKFGLEYEWSSRLSSSISGGIVHFSNGKSSTPNSGINIYGLSLGVLYQLSEPEQKTPEQITTRSSSETSYRKWIFDAQYQYGFTEQSTPGGPKYGVQVISIAGGYRYRKYLTLLGGGEYEYNSAVYDYFKNAFNTEEEAKTKAKRTAVFIENEFRYGSLFNRMKIGFYLGWPAENTNKSYIKMTTGVYLSTIPYVGRPYLAVVLKSHTAVADYLGVLVGVKI